MTILLMLLLLMSDPTGERRAKVALETAAAAERDAETAYSNGKIDMLKADLKTMTDNVQTADEALKASGKTPGRNPRPYKEAEQKSLEMLVRLGDLERKMDMSERDIVEMYKAKVQDIHDAWFDGIMSRKK